MFHIALPEHWTAALAAGAYTMSWRGQTLDDVGFVHLSFRHQIERTANRLYRDVAEVVLLEVDTSRCTGALAVERGTGEDDDVFPHLYGPIAVAAVVDGRRWPRSSDGSYALRTIDVDR